MRVRRPIQGAGRAVRAAAILASGCARFNDAISQPFTTAPEMAPGPTSTPPPPPPLPPKPFPKARPAPGVMQGCLESTSGLIMGPDSKTALVAERTTGAVKEVSVSAEPKVKMVIPVDPSGDGGLMDIVQSPTFSQDRLTYAYISTPTDNRVIRVAEGDTPKDILTGIPGGRRRQHRFADLHQPDDAGRADRRCRQSGAGGGSEVVGRQGDPHRAADDGGSGAADHRAHRDGRRRGMCIDPTDDSLFITDRTPAGDRLQRIGPDAKVSTVWTWPNRPGVAGCAALDGTILVNLVNTKQTVAVRLAQGTGAVTGDPEVVRQDTHGHAWALQVSPDGNIWGATVNRTAGDPEKLDDVVFPLFPQGGGFPAATPTTPESGALLDGEFQILVAPRQHAGQPRAHLRGLEPSGALEQHRQHGHGLQPGQRRAEAEVHSLPKVRWPLMVGRSSRNSSGASTWAGSRLAAPHSSSTIESAGRSTPATRVSRSTWR